MPFRHLAWACLLSGALASASAAEPSKLKARLAEIAGSYAPGGFTPFMGAALVARDDKILLDQGYGSANLEWAIPTSPDVKFRLGSITKQFTAALILLLQQDGKLHIGDKVGKYLEDAPATWGKVTIAQLLGHTSGIPNFTDLPEYGVWSASPRTVAELLSLFRDKPLDFEPGSTFAYSNSNFEVLGAIVEKVSGASYAENLQNRLFKPLGMANSGLDSDTLVLPKRAQGYTRTPAGFLVARSESMTVPWAAGSIYSTTGDLLKWERGLFGGKLLNAASLKAMTTPGKGDYGLGLFILDRNHKTVVQHGGGITGFNTFMAYVPDQKITVVVLGNVNGNAPDRMGWQLLDTALGTPVVLAREHKPVPIDKAQLPKYVGVYDLTGAFPITIAVAGDGLTAEAPGQPVMPAMYQGVKDGHPRFFVPPADAELEFVPGPDGSIPSLILHMDGQHTPAMKRP